jgi:hypothetical protein
MNVQDPEVRRLLIHIGNVLERIEELLKKRKRSRKSRQRKERTGK